jgi:DNA primase
MKPHFTPDYLKEARDRLGSGLIGIVSERVRLTKVGGLHKGCCPFHNEKTASFYVRDGNMGWHYVCHGCHASGDVFKWLMTQGGISDFHEAVAYVAERVGMELPAVSPEQKKKHDRLERLRQIVAITARWFGDKLYQPTGADALAYLKNERGIGDDQIKDFHLGYAPADYRCWQDLITDLTTQSGYDPAELIASGARSL